MKSDTFVINNTIVGQVVKSSGMMFSNPWSQMYFSSPSWDDTCLAATAVQLSILGDGAFESTGMAMTNQIMAVVTLPCGLDPRGR